MKNLIFLLLTINSSLLFAAYPFDNFGLLYTNVFSSNTYLRVPVVKFGDHLYTNISLKLENNGQFSLDEYTDLTDDEESLVNKINNSHCVPNEAFGRFVAKIAFVSGNQTYCLVSSFTGTDPGFYISYLFIENGKAILVQDTRYEPYQSNPEVYIVTDSISSINFGTIENQVFTEQSGIDINNLNLEGSLVLKLSDNKGELIRYF